MADWQSIPFPGETAALACAALWAAASVIYGRIGRGISPAGMTLIKNGLAIAMFAVILVASGELFTPLPAAAAWRLVAGGIIGNGLGDTLFFLALLHLGARRTLLMGCLVPPLTAVMALVFMHERLAWAAWGGIFLTVAGVSWVIRERTAADLGSGRNLALGVKAALAVVASSSVAAFLTHSALYNSDVTALQASVVKLTAGTVVMVIYLLIGRRRDTVCARLPRRPRFWPWMVLAVFSGTFLALWLQQVSLKYTAAGIAMALFTTSPLFVLPLAAGLGERISPRAVLGILVALSGVVLLCW